MVAVTMNTHDKFVISQLFHAASAPAGGKLAIVNLQQTCKDKHADVVLHAKCDDVMRTLVGALGLQLPVYQRRDTFILECTLTCSRKQTSAALSLLAADGLQCPLPMLHHVSIQIQVAS